VPSSQLLYLTLASGAIAGVLTTYVYAATGIAYRHRDNGLAYILLVLGVGVWNGLFVAQFLTQNPIVNQFFLSLTMVGALLAGLGWFLFASTASSTPVVPVRRLVYGGVAVLVGVAITLLITAPVHPFYWTVDPTQPSTLAVIAPGPGYWLHAGLLAGLFCAGTTLFAVAWRRGKSVSYSRSYTTVGGAAVVALLGSYVLAPGGLTVAPLVGVCLTTIGWLQAKGLTGERLLPNWRSLVH
jgi:hypothetical protein